MAFLSPTKIYHTDTYPSISPTLPHLSTAGKSALVTGAGTGIGASIATSLARSGISKLGLLGRRESTLLETKKTIKEISPSTTVHIYTADLSDQPAIQSAVSAFAANSAGGKIDILVANAGYMSDLSSIEASEPGDWWKGFETNVLGNFHLLQAFLPLAAKEAAIIHISSAAVWLPYLAGYSSYRASKAAATKLFEYVAGEHPELFVLQVHPGLVFSTGMSTKFLESVKGYQSDTVTLSGDFVNWAVSPEGKFLNGRFVCANWDVDELKAKAPELAKDPEKFTMGLLGLAP